MLRALAEDDPARLAAVDRRARWRAARETLQVTDWRRAAPTSPPALVGIVAGWGWALGVRYEENLS